jgi:Zn-dependent protease
MSESIVTEQASYALGADVEIVRRSKSLLLFARRSGQSVRVSPVAVDLLPLLATGSTFQQLSSRLQAAYPRAGDIGGKLDAFLATLGAAGVLRESAASLATPSVRRAGNRRITLFNPDRLANAVAKLLSQMWPGRCGVTFAWLAAIAAVAAIGTLAYLGGLPRLRDMVEHLHWSGVALFFVVVVPIHELAHAVAARLVGVPVSGAGLILHGGFFPGPYVDTSQAYQLSDRWKRFAIPAAGPLVNLTSAGLVAAALVYFDLPQPIVPTLHGLLLASLLFVFFDTNLLSASDGSHCLEAVLDDELARHYALRPGRAPTSDRSSAVRYRLAVLAYLLISALLFWMWWT